MATTFLGQPTMLRFIQILIPAAAVCCWCGSATLAGDEAHLQHPPFQFVQYKQKQQPQQPKTHSHTDKGIVSAVAADSISIVSDNKVWVLRPQPGCVIEVTGRAEPSYLKPGQMLRLYGEFDKKYKSTGPIKQLEIVSPTMVNVTPGVFPDTLPPEDEPTKADKRAEEQPKNDKAEKKLAPKATGDSATPMMIVGILKLVKDGELLITAGARSIRVQLAEEPEIRVSLADFTLAKRSDAVKKFSCEYIEPGAGYLKLLQIELNDPLEGVKKGVKKPVAKPITKQLPKASGKAK